MAEQESVEDGNGHETWSSDALSGLAQRCGLHTFDQAVLLLTLATALDRRYGRLCAYLQNDLTQAFATPGLALDLFAESFEQRAHLRSRFLPEAPLSALGLLHVAGDGSQPLLRRPLTIDEEVVQHFLAPPRREESSLSQIRDLVLPQATLDALDRICQSWQDAPPPERPLVVLSGEPGSGRRLVARRLAAAIGSGLVTSNDPWPVRDVRSALLREEALCLVDADALFEPTNAAARSALEAALRHTAMTLVACVNREEYAPFRLAGREMSLLHLPAAGTEERRRIWLQEASLADIPLDDDQARLLATTYRLNGGRIAQAVARAGVSDGGARSPLLRLAPAAKAVASVSLGRLGQEVPPRFRWDDIVLPEAVEEVLREIVLRVRHQSLVFGEWGFTARHARSTSLSALFTGPSGTGKTMAAEVIANELGLSLYRVDLSAVVSKYIGETEKNLAQIFSDASSASAVLFFDEADALFGKRSEVRDSHDRYANIEVSYLLQRLEDFDGIVILASNLRQNLDEAFVRRLHLAADFPFPDAESRLEIWRRTLPAALPLAADVDLEALARRFRLSGGNIRNACVTAAFLAAARVEPVVMSHLLRAVRREHQKMGKLVPSESDEAPA